MKLITRNIIFGIFCTGLIPTTHAAGYKPADPIPLTVAVFEEFYPDDKQGLAKLKTNFIFSHLFSRMDKKVSNEKLIAAIKEASMSPDITPSMVAAVLIKKNIDVSSPRCDCFFGICLSILPMHLTPREFTLANYPKDNSFCCEVLKLAGA